MNGSPFLKCTAENYIDLETMSIKPRPDLMNYKHELNNVAMLLLCSLYSTVMCTDVVIVIVLVTQSRTSGTYLKDGYALSKKRRT